MKFPLSIFLLLAGISLSAQEEHLFEIRHLIPSEAFGEERTITVYLPPNYYRYPSDSFTVTYVLDGQYDPFIDLTVKSIEYNVNARKITPTIVVGIHSKDRGAEFSRPRPNDGIKVVRASTLQAHLRNEVIPLIDSLYTRTRDYRSIVGHSSGGLFVLYTLFSEQADLFDGYLAISPAFRPGNNTILEDAEALLLSGSTFEKFLHCSAGTVGEREFLFGGAVKRLDSLFQRYPDNGLIWRQQHFSGLDHWSVVGPALVAGQMAQTRAFGADVKTITDFAAHPTESISDQLEAFYAARKQEYGYVDLPQDWFLNRAVSELLRLYTPDKALDYLDWATEQYPKSTRLQQQKADILFEHGEKQSARDAYELCVQLLEEQKEHISEQRYRDDLAYYQQQLSQL